MQMCRACQCILFTLGMARMTAALRLLRRLALTYLPRLLPKLGSVNQPLSIAGSANQPFRELPA